LKKSYKEGFSSGRFTAKLSSPVEVSNRSVSFQNAVGAGAITLVEAAALETGNATGLGKAPKLVVVGR